MRSEEYVVSDGTYSRVVTAETPEDAALAACQWHSVYGLRHGMEFDVFPLREAYGFRVQYERPNSEGGAHERLRDYGDPIIVRQFAKVTGGSFQDSEPSS